MTVKVAFNEATNRYHLIDVDDSNNIIKNFGMLQEANDGFTPPHTPISIGGGGESSNVFEDGIEVPAGTLNDLAIKFTGSANKRTGFFEAVADAGIGFVVAGGIRLALYSNFLKLRSDGQLGFTNTTLTNLATAALDTYLSRDAAGQLALRNGTSPQTFNVYNTYTDASNYERGFLEWSSNSFRVGTTNAGTGTARDLRFYRGGVTKLIVGSTATSMYNNLYTGTDNTYDIGADTLRWKDIYGKNLDLNGGTIILNSLPTSDPAVAGQVYSNAGVLMVSAG